jgi:hypothetical protein
MAQIKVQSHCDVRIVDHEGEIQIYDSPMGKPFLRLKFDTGQEVLITTNIAEMIGGIGAGLRKRMEDKKDPRYTP